jgi:hypothetical protein
MDIELVNLINYLHSIKHDLYKKYKPEIVDGKSVLLNRNQCDNDTEAHPKTYIKLMHQQRRLLYGANAEAKDKATKHVQDLTEQLDTVEDTSEKVKITLKCASTQVNTELCKPWNKLPTNLKIQSILKFIELLVPKLTDEQKNQMRYLLISAISQKKLTKQSDVDYDSTNGYIIKIHKLTYDGNMFDLLGENDTQPVSFNYIVNPIDPSKLKKKLILIKKNDS